MNDVDQVFKEVNESELEGLDAAKLLAALLGQKVAFFDTKGRSDRIYVATPEGQGNVLKAPANGKANAAFDDAVLSSDALPIVRTSEISYSTNEETYDFFVRDSLEDFLDHVIEHVTPP